jgi:hypothetical protein
MAAAHPNSLLATLAEMKDHPMTISTEELVTTNITTFLKSEYNQCSLIVREVDRLNRKTAFTLLPLLSGEDSLTHLKLGGVLSKIREREWDKPYRSFSEFVQREPVPVDYTYATRAIRLYDSMRRSRVEWSQVGSLSLGKLLVIADIIRPYNVDYWVAVAEKQTRDHLRETVYAASRAKVAFRAAVKVAPEVGGANPASCQGAPPTSPQDAPRPHRDAVNRSGKDTMDMLNLMWAAGSEQCAKAMQLLFPQPTTQ